MGCLALATARESRARQTRGPACPGSHRPREAVVNTLIWEGPRTSGANAGWRHQGSLHTSQSPGHARSDVSLALSRRPRPALLRACAVVATAAARSSMRTTRAHHSRHRAPPLGVLRVRTPLPSRPPPASGFLSSRRPRPGGCRDLPGRRERKAGRGKTSSVRHGAVWKNPGEAAQRAGERCGGDRRVGVRAWAWGSETPRHCSPRGWGSASPGLPGASGGGGGARGGPAGLPCAAVRGRRTRAWSRPPLGASRRVALPSAAVLWRPPPAALLLGVRAAVCEAPPNDASLPGDRETPALEKVVSPAQPWQVRRLRAPACRSGWLSFPVGRPRARGPSRENCHVTVGVGRVVRAAGRPFPQLAPSFVNGRAEATLCR